ncbi:hypothetical protein AUJ68_06435 [Candidatus Woesearchaeota archaeon CG1_02_57_44]|nr:MAG: hypothetical protein AUJ68_06435 [Candidatus Woesearchaeota archaeon CG1_02_57_44]PIN68349.1 MAG: hypothetical protein COV94_05140 [Candidatus Woesearchaeota archaeon CG11_big_fil_rev_8_21_14_0_20_57_5]
MRAWLMDAYRHSDELMLWLKTPERERCMTAPGRAVCYAEDNRQARALLQDLRIVYTTVTREHPLHGPTDILRITTRLDRFEQIVRAIERKSRYRLALFDADVTPEQRFFYQHRVYPGALCDIRSHPFTINTIADAPPPVLSAIELSVTGRNTVERITAGQKTFTGEERSLLKDFASWFQNKDPDVIVMERGFARLPFLAERLAHLRIACPLHRWHEAPLRYRGGRSFWSYGSVRYQDYAVRLNGRFLVDTSTMLGSMCSPDALLELCCLSAQRFQQLASRSAGAAFQAALVKEMAQRGILIPYKEKPIDRPLTFSQLLKADRTGHTFDPVPGFHRDVAEIDFSSMYPWLMYNRNISAETVLSDSVVREQAPGIAVSMALDRKGLVPLAIKAFLDRRMRLKATPTAENKERAQGLKWVLVSSYGYLRFREFKLGLATSHMATCAFARETLIDAAKLAEQQGFRVLHGIIDSLYVTRPGMTGEQVRRLCEDIHAQAGIPVSFEGIFDWIVFLPSVNDRRKPLPAAYYGVFSHGAIKARGIELRQRSCPPYVALFQRRCIEAMAKARSEEEMRAMLPALGRMLRRAVQHLPAVPAQLLCHRVTISKRSYGRDIPQRTILAQLRRHGVEVAPGQSIAYVMDARGPVLPQDYKGSPDIAYYRRRLARALFVLLQPVGISRQDVQAYVMPERQAVLDEWA